MIQFPDADIHKWVEGDELLIIISPPIKCKPAQQWKFPEKQDFFLVLKQPSPKCSSLQPTALMDAALLSFPGDSSQHYSSFSRSNQSSRASSCCCLVYSPLWSNPKNNLLLTPPPLLTLFFFFGPMLHARRAGIMLLERNTLKVTHLVLNQEPFIRKISIYQISDTHFN